MSRKFGEVELPLFVQEIEGAVWLKIQLKNGRASHVKTVNIEGKKYIALSPAAASLIFDELRNAYNADEYGEVSDTITVEGKQYSELYVEIIDTEKFNELETMITDSSIRNTQFNKKANLNQGKDAPDSASKSRMSNPRPAEKYRSEEEREWDDDQNFWTPGGSFFQKEKESEQFDEFDRERLAK